MKPDEISDAPDRTEQRSRFHSVWFNRGNQTTADEFWQKLEMFFI